MIGPDFPAPHRIQRPLALDNLVDFLACCLTHEKAANEAFLVSDGDDLSTAGLVRAIATAAGGRGGGRPDRAEGGVPGPEALALAVAKMEALLG